MVHGQNPKGHCMVSELYTLPQTPRGRTVCFRVLTLTVIRLHPRQSYSRPKDNGSAEGLLCVRILASACHGLWQDCRTMSRPLKDEDNDTSCPRLVWPYKGLRARSQDFGVTCGHRYDCVRARRDGCWCWNSNHGGRMCPIGIPVPFDERLKWLRRDKSWLGTCSLDLESTARQPQLLSMRRKGITWSP